ncbi:DUF3618 domain-containing protein [Polymorphobacter arshaanensis]|uniref:DUF3618 domain-containing protein n=1 Tax=Glacieibacterium arshaanense TaxID=2511025 RepID=A0A4Y9ESF5_9SPHN|nr:DUF3618 domain-containing protein [Polymorphobacter arshaanensis]TFU06565.1 DUF3618 domain-containing protein [Polymorphobacter arshaanensis]
MTDNSNRSVESYAADVEATRARIAATIDTLQDRLQPRVLATQAVESLAQTALTAFAGSGTAMLALTRKLLRDHPVATAAAGLGIGVALIARNRLSHAEVNVGDDYEPYSDFDDEPALRLVDNVQTEASGAVEENPLAAVLAGLAAGALLGALFPETRAENKLIGRHSDKVSTAARAAARAARAELLSRDAA